MNSEDIHLYMPDGEEKTNEEKPKLFATKAQEHINNGFNVAVDKPNPYVDLYNVAYINTWNEYAEQRGLWVKSLKDVNKMPDCDNYVTITVGICS